MKFVHLISKFCDIIGDRAAQISLYDDSSTSNVELKLLNRQLMHSIRGNTRQDAIWSFTSGYFGFNFPNSFLREQRRK